MNSVSDSEDADIDQTAMLTGFLFGNINESGQLEDDFLDEESRNRIGKLASFCSDSLVKELVDRETRDNLGETDGDDEEDEDEGESVGKNDDAIDFSDINEVMDENYDTTSPKDDLISAVVPYDIISQSYDMNGTKTAESSANDYDIEDENIDSGVTPQSDLINAVPSTDGTEVSLKPMMQTPLASMIPPGLMKKDVREWFPEFKFGKVLRFCRLFKPVHNPNIWKKKKKKRQQELETKQTHETGSRMGHNSPHPSMDINHRGDGEDVPDYSSSFGYRLARSPRSDELDVDDLESFLKEEVIKVDNSEPGSESGPNPAAWRHGPARLWYDMMGVPEDGKGFSYGFKLKQTPADVNNTIATVVEGGETFSLKRKSSGDDPGAKKPKVEVPEEAHLMLTQTNWENDVIWNGEDVKAKILDDLKRKIPKAGWFLSSNTRTFSEYIDKYHPDKKITNGYSLLPFENEELISGKWIEDIIWDAQAMDKIPEPKVLTLDMGDENLIINVPDESEIASREKQQLLLQQQQQEAANPKKEKELKKSKMASVKTKEEEENQQEESEMPRKNPFNISNDEYYNPKLTTDNALGRNLGVSMILHSTPAAELRQPFFPCHLSLLKLRNFHRPHLKKYSHGAMVSPGPHPVLPLLKYIRRKEKLREQERLASGGGDMFFMRTADDLTGRDGEIVLAEYSEQYPPLVNQIGMATKIKNYYKRKPGNNESDPPQFIYGELAYAHTSPFLGSLQPGQSLQAFENNMFRAPIYSHKIPQTDFLVIRNRNNYYIREMDALFAVGQECPLIEVPNPASKRANNFLRDFLQLFIYRLFWISRDSPRRIKMEEVRKAFPTHSESSIRKRLKLCSDFKRTGIDSNWWVLKNNARLPSEEEMREMVSPEQCCAYYSMLAAEQRLKDAGYGEKSLFAIDDDNEEDSKCEDEVKAAPWSTTSAYISAMKGKCLLAVNNPVADPTGCGEGFSYVKMPNKPQTGKDDQSAQAAMKRSVVGTDADLRRLPLKEAKVLLRKLGVDEATVKKLSRWEVINQIRTMSTEQAKSSQDGGGICKFARGNRFSIAEHHEKYKEDCQRLFDLQNKLLGSDEVLSSDEDGSMGEESDLEEQGKNLTNILSSEKSTSQLNMEREEAERRELAKMLKGEKVKKESSMSSAPAVGTRKLKITRTFREDNGREFQRIEIIKKANIVDKYIRIRESKDANYIQQFSVLDDHQKEEMKREKKRLQEQLRRLKRMQDGSTTNMTSLLDASKKKTKSGKEGGGSKSSKPLKPNKLKCGACGQTGHMRTNRECPMFSKSLTPIGAVGNVALSEEQQEELEKAEIKDEALVNIEGTKVTLSKQLIKQAEDIKKKSLVLKFPKLSKEEKRRRMSSVSLQDDYLKKPKKLFNRRRADPVVTLSSIFEGILKEMKDLPCSLQFLYPVNAKLVTDYYDVIKKPMSLQTIRENLRGRKYQSRESFVVDVNQIVRNCELYNGANSPLTASARQMFEYCLQRIAEKEEKLMKLEKAINPLLDDDDMVSFSYILTSIIEDRLKIIEGSVPFHTPVNKKQYKDYYAAIKNPMDLSTMHKKATDHQYFSREDFLKDLHLIVTNCLTYNGPINPLSVTAKKLEEVCLEAMEEQELTLVALEQNIMAAREAAIDAVETDSIMTGTSLTGADDDQSSRAKYPRFTIGDENSKDAIGRTSDRDYDDDDDDDEMLDVDDYEKSDFRVDSHPFAGLGSSREDRESNMLSQLQMELEVSESSESEDDGKLDLSLDREDEDESFQDPLHGKSATNSWAVSGCGDTCLEEGEIADDSGCMPPDMAGAGDSEPDGSMFS